MVTNLEVSYKPFISSFLAAAHFNTNHYAADKMFEMTKDVIDSHQMRERVVGYVSDTPRTMKALW